MEPSAPAAGQQRARAVGGYVAALALLAAGLVAALLGGDPPGQGSAVALPVLALLVTGAERAQVRYRVGRDVDGLNLLEAALAPLLFAYPAHQAVLAVAAGQALAAVLARNAPVKSAFNVAQWSLATACGSAVVLAVGGEGLQARSLLGVLAGLVVVALVNNTAFAGVLAVSGGGAVLRRLRPLLVPAWMVGLGLNAAVGLLYVVAFAETPRAVVLFAAPLLVLHLAYRGQAAAHAERGLVSGLHRAGQALSTPLDAREAVAPWLREVASTFDARSVVLALPGPDGAGEVHRYEDDAVQSGPDGGLLAALGPLTGPVRLGPEAPALRGTGARGGLAAPLREDGGQGGALLVLDVSGLEGARTSELPVLAALAREAAAAFGRGRLLADVLEERRKLDELVSTTSDGILSLDADGVVRSWNPALERLTGLPARAVVGVPGALDVLGLRDAAGRAVRPQRWHAAEDRPAELQLDGAEGPRRVACSYSLAPGSDTLVVVARDVTPAREVAELRRQFARLVEAEAAQRVVVEHLQRAVMPPLPDLAGAELGVRYVASDPSEPTGGDLYDCQVLPDGTVHLAVVDVLGHGVQATQHALSVAHTIRTVVLDGTPLEDVVRRADLLLGRQDPDLVATVVLARYTPSTGLLRLAGGGHPPPLVVQADGTAVQVEVEGGAVGWPLAGSDGVAEVTLGPGDALVLYTDGLVEARKDIVQGLEALGVLAGTLVARPAEAFAQALVDDALSGADRRDDTLALVLRRAPAARADVDTDARWQLGADPAQAGAVRREVAAWAGAHGLPTDEVALVAGELLANAVVAARSAVTLSGRVERRDDGVRLHLEVDDDGGGFEAVPAAPRPVDECGRGLLIVEALASDVQVRSTARGTTVAVVLRA